MKNLNNEYENHWQYLGNNFDSCDIGDNFGFVYTIVNINSGRQYIGKKWFYSTRKINGKRKKLESDWKSYYGSNDELKNDIKQYGINNFKRIITKLCKTKSECSYYEAKEQFEKDVLFDDMFYNSWIMCRINKKHVFKK